MAVRARRQQKPELRFAVVAVSPGVKRERVGLELALVARRCGEGVELFLGLNPETTVSK